IERSEQRPRIGQEITKRAKRSASAVIIRRTDENRIVVDAISIGVVVRAPWPVQAQVRYSIKTGAFETVIASVATHQSLRIASGQAVFVHAEPIRVRIGAERCEVNNGV